MWICNICSEKNEESYAYCNGCGIKRPDTDDDPGPREDEENVWFCKCGNVNKMEYSFCQCCGKKKPPVKKENPSPWPGTDSKTLIICISAIIVALILSVTAIIVLKPSHQTEQTVISANAYLQPVDDTETDKAEQPAISGNVYPQPVDGTQTGGAEQPNVYPVAQEKVYYEKWSDWSTIRPNASDSLEIEEREVASVVGYWMVHYGTQEAKSPHYRMFRDYSIKGNLDKYGARTSYGEKQLTKYVSAEAFNTARVYPADGEMIVINYGRETYSGYQLGTQQAYNFGDDKYVWYIESENIEYITEYRYKEYR